MAEDASPRLADWLDRLAAAGEALSGDPLWAREDGRALSAFVEDLRLHSREAGTMIDASELHAVLSDAMETVAKTSGKEDLVPRIAKLRSKETERFEKRMRWIADGKDGGP